MTSPVVELNKEEAEAAIGSLQRFIKFETVGSIAEKSGAYVECAKYIMEQLTSLNCLVDIECIPEAPDHSPVVVATWEGQDRTLPVLLLNSHYDVVPANPNDWSVPPFDGVRKNGKIYGRGSQDMKCVCIQYIEAIRKLNQECTNGWKPQRDIVLTFVPDEEVGGGGMAAFLESQRYKNLKQGIALALDEGLASTEDTFSVFYGERLPWWIDITATGPTGHGSRFIENTAVEQLIALSNKALQFRQKEKEKLGMTSHENCTHAVVAKQETEKNDTTTTNGKSTSNTLGDVTSLNITSLEAGVRAGGNVVYNCVPPLAKCTLDIRISPHMEPQSIHDMLDLWCSECSKDASNGSKITWKESTIQPNIYKHSTTSIDGAINPWYNRFQTTMNTTLGYTIRPQVFPAATDSRFLRALGIRALGFSPMHNTEILLHENDEYILESNFIEGIRIYVTLIHSLASYIEDDANGEEKNPDSNKRIKLDSK